MHECNHIIIRRKSNDILRPSDNTHAGTLTSIYACTETEITQTHTFMLLRIRLTLRGTHTDKQKECKPILPSQSYQLHLGYWSVRTAPTSLSSTHLHGEREEERFHSSYLCFISVIPPWLCTLSLYFPPLFLPSILLVPLSLFSVPGPFQVISHLPPLIIPRTHTFPSLSDTHKHRHTWRMHIQSQ